VCRTHLNTFCGFKWTRRVSRTVLKFLMGREWSERTAKRRKIEDALAGTDDAAFEDAFH